MNKLMFDPQVNQNVSLSHSLWIEMITEGLLKREFLYYYQPKYNIDTEEIIGYEALARWNNSQYGAILPMHFIPFIMQNDLWNAFFFNVFSMGLVFQEKINQKRNNLTFSYNIDVQQLKEFDFADKVNILIESKKVEFENVIFEVTETSSGFGNENVIMNLLKFMEKGIKISMDDYGKSYSSLSRLLKFPFSEIKLDSSYIQNAVINPNSINKIERTQVLAKHLGLSFIVEGVENKKQLSILKSIGCKFAQGYYFSKPMHPIEIT